MDFETPYCVREALQGVIDKGVYGYNYIPDEYFTSIIQWLQKVQGWSVEAQWLSFIPGIVKGIGYVINYFTKEGDGIIVQPPIYPPFMNLPKGNNRKLLFNPLVGTEHSCCRAMISLSLRTFSQSSISSFMCLLANVPGRSEYLNMNAAS